LAVYIYRLDTFVLETVLAGFDKTITALCWSMHDTNVLATTSGEKDIKIWDIATEKVIAIVQTGQFLPKTLKWAPHDPQLLATVSKAGTVLVWNYTKGKNQPINYGALDATCFSWHPNGGRAGCFAVGVVKGDLLIGQPGERKLKKFTPPSLAKQPIVEVEWDPLSETYLIAASEKGDIVLFDTSTGSEMTVFDRQAGGLRTMSFIPGEPGSFATAGDKTGIIRTWNVSQKSPKGAARPSKAGFQNMTFAPGELGTNGVATICSFINGSFGVYDLRKKQWKFLTEEAHIETIFDCRFKPSDPNLMATVSYDGTIKLWKIQTMECVSSVTCGDLKNPTGSIGDVLYGASWAPGTDDRIVASSATGAIFVVEIVPGRGKVLLNMQVHEYNKPSFRCAWNPVDKDYVVSTSSDCSAAVTRVVGSGEIVRRYAHPMPVFGCDWHTVDGKRFVTGCQDGIVRLFDRTADGVLMTLRGHTSKVFNTVWSPLLPHMLMSGSDDGTVIVWDTAVLDSTPVVLHGHTQNVRALLWHSEIPWMVISGSWDSTIRVWDFRKQACLRVVADHHADVYGLGCHPSRPFLFVSSSRDNTIRQWRLDDIVRQLSAKVVVADVNAFESITGTVVESMALDAPLLLAGPVSRSMLESLRSCRDDNSRRSLLCSFFLAPCDVKEILNLSETILTGVTASVHNRIVHSTDVLKSVHATAQAYEGARVARFTGVGGAKTEDQLAAAAALYLRLGLFEQHCELLVELGQWEKAMAIAPGASIAYWQKLSMRYADHLESIGKFEEAVPYLAATHSVDRFISNVVAHGKLEDAFVVAKAACEGRFNPLDVRNGTAVPAASADDDSRLADVSRLLAQRHSEMAQPILAAACRLAVSDAKAAVRHLYFGNELVLAASLAMSMGVTHHMAEICEELSLSLEASGHWSEALLVLAKIPSADRALDARSLCCARYIESEQYPSPDAFYAHAGLDPPEAYAARAAGAARAGLPGEALRFHAMGRDAAATAKLGVVELRRVLDDPDWYG
jgi:WD40 repeat protein